MRHSTNILGFLKVNQVDAPPLLLNHNVTIPSRDICNFQSMLTPLSTSGENSLNPCFVAFVITITEIVFAIFAAFQVSQFLYNGFCGPYKIKYSFGSSTSVKSVGVSQIIKLLAIAVQLVFTSFLLGVNFVSFYDIKTISLLAFILATILFIIPLHLIEPTRSIIPLASGLLFWTVNIVISGFVLLQDSISSQKLYQPQSSSPFAAASVFTIEALMLINSFAILILELYFYSPTRELIDYFELNEWDSTSIRDIYTELTINWLQPTIKEIYEKDELNEDKMKLPNMPTILETDKAYDSLLKEWRKQTKKNGKNASLSIPLLASNAKEFIMVYFLNLTELILSFTQPFLLRKLLILFTQITDRSTKESPQPILGFIIVLAMFLVACGRFILTNRGYILVFRIIFKIQASLSALIYQKALKLSPEARKSKTTGDIINHLSTDVATIEEISQLLVELINNPLSLIICLVSLHSIIGNATWGGFLVALILVPLSTKVSTSIFLLYNEGLEYKDARIRLTSEILNSIKSIKLYSWEKPMLERLDSVRNEKELDTNKRIGVFNAFSTFLWSCIPFCISCASFATYVYISDIPLTPAIVFPALSLFDMLTDPILMLPNTFSSLVEIRVSLKRLNEYFLMDELENSQSERTFNPLQRDDISVDIARTTFVWKTTQSGETPLETDIALKDINFTARKGQLTCIVGRVGSGKSTLIKGILGEIPVQNGNTDSYLMVNGTIAYCSQSPWILNATVKENILFGCRYNKQFYDKTIQACELLSDFSSLPDGDKTVVGEKGISLSGGQKARISLARAVYARADIYLLDDVLSAVDAHVGKNIIKNVLSKHGILATKTIILASNSVNVLPEAHNIVLLKSGSIVERGTYKEVMRKTSSDLATLIREFGKHNDEVEGEAEEDLTEVITTNIESGAASIDSSEVKDYKPELEDSETLHQVRSRSQSIGTASLMPFLHNYDLEEEEEVLEQVGEDGLPPKKKKTGHSKEESAKGRVQLAVYLEYFRACNYSYILLYLFLTSATIGTGVLGKYLLKYWSELNEASGENTDPSTYLGFYTFLGVLGGALTLIAAFVVWTYCIIRGSKYFHDKMAKLVLRSPMSFFETTPIGRILNRFSEDIGMIDNHLPWVIIDLLEYVLNGFAIFSVIVINLPPMAIMIFVLMIVYNEIRKFFIPASREFKRLRAARKSPVFSHLQELVNGVETLRAYDQQDRFTFKNKYNLDERIHVDYLLTMCNRWLSLRLQFISAILLLSSGLAIILTINTSFELSSGLVGFVMSYALSITGILTAIVRRWAEVESRSVSIERLVEYCNLPSEAEMINPDDRPKLSWPSEGSIDFVNYSTKYRENLDPVLKNISLNIKSSEKIGIVGRTGAGKSSLTLALFRIIEATTGNINIDNMNTSDIGLFDLRSKLSIIPQDSHTVEGSVRQNLDPFGKFTDQELWKVLELAHLKEHVESMKTDPTEKDGEIVGETLFGLDAQVYEGGSNLSSGQKQLLCLARALLNPSKVLILDEATAAVDVQTDKIIQDTIRKEFKDKTILTIAHRLDTIMDSDRVVVLDKGEVKEFASVDELLAMDNGIFRLLCEEGGYLK